MMMVSDDNLQKRKTEGAGGSSDVQVHWFRDDEEKKNEKGTLNNNCELASSRVGDGNLVWTLEEGKMMVGKASRDMELL